MNEPEPDVTFADLGLSDRLLATLADVGYETPSAIQAETIPVLLAGRDVVGLAQTGTGKTAAFALPILDNLDPAAGAPQALVLTPTRELAVQVCEAFERYAARLPHVNVLPVYGGQGYGVQLSALRRGVHVVVGTPGRIIDHLNKGTLDLSRLSHLVLDEADEMLTMGFAEDVETILATTPNDKQVALFSATMPASIRRLTGRYLTDPVEITVKGKTATATNIAQRYLVTTQQQKLETLTRLLEVENFEAMIVFVRTKHETETLAERLRARGFSAMAINGDMVQAQRERTVQQLKDAALDILVATDVAARGLDVSRITHVVNFDIPSDTESYVHRIGRTGRAGRSGDAISFITPREQYLLRHIEKATKQALTKMPLPTADEVNESRLARFDDRITEALESGRIEFFRDVVSHYVREHNVPEVDVAAALAIVMQGDSPMLLDTDLAEPDHEPSRRRKSRNSSPGPDRQARTDREPGAGRDDLVTYKIAVGKRHKVDPRMIVGAIANEGKLSRSDFGRITIRPDHSLVELPARIDQQSWEALKKTRISGRLINLSPDRPAGGRRNGQGRPAGHKSRHKKRR